VTPDLQAALETVMAEQRRCRENPARVGGLEYALTAFAPAARLAEQRVEESERMFAQAQDVNRDYAGRLEDALHRIEALERVVEAARAERVRDLVRTAEGLEDATCTEDYERWAQTPEARERDYALDALAALDGKEEE
jgi:hypothetical protein